MLAERYSLSQFESQLPKRREWVSVCRIRDVWFRGGSRIYAELSLVGQCLTPPVVPNNCRGVR